MAKRKFIRSGDIRETTKGLPYKVLDYSEGIYADVEFLNTGTTRRVHKSGVIKNTLKDFMAPTVRGVGYIGKDTSKFPMSPLEFKVSHVWRQMIQRCYLNDKGKRAYIDCKVSAEWYNFTNFYKWMIDEGYREGLEIDTDLLCKGFKEYSPSTCVLVTPNINKALQMLPNHSTNLPTGVTFCVNSDKYRAVCSSYGTPKYLGYYDTKESAHIAYKQFKEKYIRELATDSYNKGLISEKVYKAMLKFKIQENNLN